MTAKYPGIFITEPSNLTPPKASRCELPFDPLREALQIYEVLYGASCDICFEILNGAAGMTIFHAAPNRARVLINPNLPLIFVVSVLMHELAHVVVGPHIPYEEGHGEKWQDINKRLCEEYNARFPFTMIKAVPTGDNITDEMVEFVREGRLW